MNMEKPITPKEKDGRFDGALFDEAVRYINEAITIKMWHDNFADREKYRKDYYAIALSPYGHFNSIVMDKAVAAFQEAGWNCLWKSCYDVRGPHDCFYVGREHFIN